MLYVCVTKGQSWDVESRISLVVSMLPSNLEGKRKNDSRDSQGHEDNTARGPAGMDLQPQGKGPSQEEHAYAHHTALTVEWPPRVCSRAFLHTESDEKSCT